MGTKNEVKNVISESDEPYFHTKRKKTKKKRKKIIKVTSTAEPIDDFDLNNKSKNLVETKVSNRFNEEIVEKPKGTDNEAFDADSESSIIDLDKINEKNENRTEKTERFTVQMTPVDKPVDFHTYLDSQVDNQR